jgi:hypothetical protein
MAAGSLAAHRLGFVLFSPRPAGSHHEVVPHLERLEHGPHQNSLALPPPWLTGLLAAVAIVVVAQWLDARFRDRPRTGASAGWFLSLPLLGYTFQEAAERVGHWEPLAHHTVNEPPFWAALLLQLPFALVAYWLAGWLRAAARELVAVFREQRPPTHERARAGGVAAGTTWRPVIPTLLGARRVRAPPQPAV